MTGGLVPAAVTAALRAILREALAAEELEGLLRGTEVSTLPPDRIEAEGGGSGLNLFCYRVVPRLDTRAAPRPRLARVGDDGEPDLALDLHYLLSAHTHEDLAAELLLGVGVRCLEVAALDPSAVPPELMEAGRLTQVLDGVLAGIERILVSPEPLSVEDMSRLWMSLGTPYRPSMTFRATVRS
ncbi:MAG TPA: DUF4255 domain-containing protein [Longimicrobiales bacterium]|nr:DUF4255 domain-containing protein [Longimicrobiales bacterium]